MELNGTEEYIEHIVTAYSSTLLRLAYTILHSAADAEDAVQEVFIRLMTKKPEFSGSEHEKAWLIRVTVNISRNMLKSAARHSAPLDGDLASPEPESLGELLDAVMKLPERYGTVLHLYYYEGYSIKEISEILRLPAATVGTRLARGRTLLKISLEGEV